MKLYLTPPNFTTHGTSAATVASKSPSRRTVVGVGVLGVVDDAIIEEEESAEDTAMELETTGDGTDEELAISDEDNGVDEAAVEETNELEGSSGVGVGVGVGEATLELDTSSELELAMLEDAMLD
jgi:hypothetical protein